MAPLDPHVVGRATGPTGWRCCSSRSSRGSVVLPGVAIAAPGGQQLNAADMTLLNGVRLAGLWEMPAGQMAAEKGQSATGPGDRRGDRRQHGGSTSWSWRRPTSWARASPSEPTAEQKGWLTEMQNATGAQFDQIFVTRLRVAHGKIFPVIGAVRASTRDATVRKLCRRRQQVRAAPHADAGEHRAGPVAATAAGRAARAGTGRAAGRRRGERRPAGRGQQHRRLGWSSCRARAPAGSPPSG